MGLAGILRPPQARPTAINSPALLLDTQDASTLTLSSGRVAAWNDKSGNGRNYAGGGSTANPYWYERGKAISFRHAQYLSMSSPFLGGLTGGCSIFMVARVARIHNSNTAGTFMGEGSTSSANPIYYLHTPVSSANALRAFVRKDNNSGALDMQATSQFTYPFNFVSRQTLPDAAHGGTPSGKGFTCTGLHRESDGTWLIGNDGRADESDLTYDPSIVKVSADFTTKLWELGLGAIYPLMESCQGVCVDPTNDSIWFASPAEGKIRNVTRGGVDLGYIQTGTGTSGVAYDASFDGFWTTQGDTVKKWSRAGVESQSIDLAAAGITTADALQLIGNELWFTVDGNPDMVQRLDLSTSEISPPYYVPEADKIEGLWYDGTYLYIVHDSYFHVGTSPYNEMVKYLHHETDGYELIALTENRSTGTLYMNGVAVGTPTAMGAIVGSFTPNRSAIGCLIRTTIDQHLYGAIKAILVVPNVPSQSERERIEGILAWHCRIERRLDSAHPYRWQPPRS